MQERVWLPKEFFQELHRFALLQRLILSDRIGVEELMEFFSPTPPWQAVGHEDERPLPARAVKDKNQSQKLHTSGKKGEMSLTVPSSQREVDQSSLLNAYPRALTRPRASQG